MLTYRNGQGYLIAVRCDKCYEKVAMELINNRAFCKECISSKESK